MAKDRVGPSQGIRFDLPDSQGQRDERTPTTLEAVLDLATRDAGFRAALLSDRLRAIESRGISLSENESNVLASFTDERLAETLEQMRLADAKPAKAEMPVERLMSAGISPGSGFFRRLFRRLKG